MKIGIKRLSALSATTLVGAVLAVGAAMPANAVTGVPVGVDGITGMCSDILCLYYHSPSLGFGAIYGTNSLTINDFGTAKFSKNPGASSYGGSPTAGAGDLVKNDAAAAENDSVYDTDYIYYNSSSYGWGNYDYLAPLTFGKLDETYNNDAAFSIYYEG